MHYLLVLNDVNVDPSRLCTGNGITSIGQWIAVAYDQQLTTFPPLATKNENIKPAEVIGNLNLQNNIDFQGLSEDLEVCQQEIRRWNDAVRAVNVDAECK